MTDHPGRRRRAVRRRGRPRRARPAARAAGRRRPAGRAGARARAAASTCPGYEVLDLRGARGRGGQDRRGARRLLGAAGRGRVHPLRRGGDRGRRRDDRPRRVRGRDLAARGPGRARADLAARHGRRRGRAARPASTPVRARTSSAPSTSPPACCATSTCWRRCPPPSWSAGWARWSSAASSPIPRSSPWSRRTRLPPSTRPPTCWPSWSSARSGSRPRSSPTDLRETGGVGGHPGREVLNYGHTLGARDREGTAATRSGTARPSRSAWSTSPSWPGWPAGSTRRPPRGTPRCWARWGCRRRGRARRSTTCWR